MPARDRRDAGRQLGELVAAEVTGLADSQAVVENRLRQQQLNPVKVKKRGALANVQFGSGVKPKEIVVFTRQFATMIDAGLPLVQCLDILGNQEEDKNFAEVILQTRTAVEGGAALCREINRAAFGQQILERKHLLDRREITCDRADPFAVDPAGPCGDRCERFRP